MSCSATTLKGTKCKRKATITDYCSQHAKVLNITVDTSSAITITFCDSAENHVGMEQIGDKSVSGFTLDDLRRVKDHFDIPSEGDDIRCELYDLNVALPDELNHNVENAYILIIRQGVKAFVDPKTLEKELLSLSWDTKAYMRGRVVNKLKRHNLCFADYSQEPDYEAGKGRIIEYSKVGNLSEVRTGLGSILGEVGQDLVAEGNLYYDVSKCGIEYHGDAERRKVIGLRLGTSIPLVYSWFLNSKPVGVPVNITLNSGDMYIMSNKAVGYDWKERSKMTLRHAAGSNECISLDRFK